MRKYYAFAGPGSGPMGSDRGAGRPGSVPGLEFSLPDGGNAGREANANNPAPTSRALPRLPVHSCCFGSPDRRKAALALGRASLAEGGAVERVMVEWVSKRSNLFLVLPRSRRRVVTAAARGGYSCDFFPDMHDLWGPDDRGFLFAGLPSSL